jgi:hypothetical protein
MLPRTALRRFIRTALCVVTANGLPLAIGHADLFAAAVTSERQFDFEVRLDDRPVGSHRFTVREEGGGTALVNSEATFDVRLLGITVYRYRHRATERWAEGCLTAMDATTDDNGRRLRVLGGLRDGRFLLEQPATATAPSACLLGYAYWDRDRLLRQRTLLNPQTGVLDAVRFESLGETPLQVRGVAQAADHFRLHSAQFVIDLWYSKTGEWLQLESTTTSRRRLHYRLRPGARVAPAG